MAMMGSATASGVDRAVDAARHAVSSPLLEDTSIAGARGLLVNVTAGMDMAIGEFEEVGNVVRELASEDATVVIGTVLDSEMKGDLRVTMVATGIGGAGAEKRPEQWSEQRPERPERSERRSQRRAEREEQVIEELPKAVNYEEFDAPTVIRHRRESGDMSGVGDDGDMEHLDIPAFLRKQAD